MTPNTEHILAVYPGSFDPVTLGHLDVIRRACRLFNELIIGIGRNPGKDMMFTPQERLDLLEPLLAEWPHVRAESYDGLTFDFVRQCNARVIVRGSKGKYCERHIFSSSFTFHRHILARFPGRRISPIRSEIDENRKKIQKNHEYC